MSYPFILNIFPHAWFCFSSIIFLLLLFSFVLLFFFVYLIDVNWYIYIPYWGRRVIGISGSLIWSKTLKELIFNPGGEFRWSPEGPVSQIHSPHLYIGAPRIFSDLLRSVQMLKWEWGAESNGKLPHLFIPIKTAALIPEFAVEDLPSAELHPWFLALPVKDLPLGRTLKWLFPDMYFEFLHFRFHPLTKVFFYHINHRRQLPISNTFETNWKLFLDIWNLRDVGRKSNVYRILIGKSDEKRRLGGSKLRWRDNIKIDFREMGCDVGDWKDLTQDRALWRD